MKNIDVKNSKIFKITENCYNQIIKNSSENHQLNFKDWLFGVIEYNDGEKRSFGSIPININNKNIIGYFPDLTMLFLNLSIENFNKSEQIKKLDFLKNSKSLKNNLYLLESNIDYTNKFLVNYIKYRIDSIIMSIMTIESFMNQCINDILNDNFECKIDKKMKNKIEIERCSIKNKLNIILPHLTKDYDIKEKDYIISSIYIRDELIHLKTKSKDDLSTYTEIIKKMLDLDLNRLIISIINLMNNIKKDYIII